MLIVLSGLPGSGKTTLARLLARRLGAFHLRIDAIEHGISQSSLRVEGPEDAGYLAAFALAEENLRLGACVIADSVNPIELSREGWRAVATRAGVPSIDVEVICSDVEAHRRRVEDRLGDMPGFRVPTWREVEEREYQAWSTPRLVIDTASRDPDDCVDEIARQLPA